MDNIAQESEIIGSIYEASYNPNAWPETLEQIARYTHSDSAALVYQDNELLNVNATFAHNIPGSHLEKHRSYGVDPNFMIMSENVPVGVVKWSNCFVHPG